MAIERVFPNLTFRRLTNLVEPDDGRDMLFVTEQAGMIRSFPARPDVTETVVFLDITDRVNEGGNEEGLLGLAFASDYAKSGYFYVYYSDRDPRRSVLSRFRASRN
ncbi:MAG: PQQ-dependent sugar dehydrogenase, partial [Proteobacteria bacterium]|nr:PQQ-dependent sugar dehydrogenase [Pseudomonadota bacterium]